MVDTVEKVLNPVLLTTFFLGFGILRYPSNISRYRLSIFYILTVWSVYAYALYYITSSIKNVFNSPLVFFIMIVNLFVAMISIIIAICEHKKHRQCMKKLSLVDDTLEKLGTAKEYHRMQNLTRQILIMWFLITCISSIFDSFLCMTVHDDIKAILIPYILNYSVYANTLTDIKFVLLLRYIGIRLDNINDHIQQLSETENLKCKNLKTAKNRKHVLWIAM
ncbi:uncharacterized protein LOC114255497 [Monomorium pharaonis]|uniref:uncharacterized protein LOC114255497 n=1 Tax=Monomorium pharaonis TaxID=307658 RepID=UPI00102E1154|nr:uncharacterized protein LOC114255497 [Monomorium pharaonis]